MRRITALLLALALFTGCDTFHEVQQQDSIEAYESYLQEHPNSRWQLQAETRLEELYLEKAAADATLEAYDLYLSKFPEGDFRAKAMEQRETMLYTWAQGEATTEAWQKYLEEYPDAPKKRKQEARRAIKLADYIAFIEVGEITKRRVNLAEDPKGPQNGWEFTAEITNKGDKTLPYLNLAFSWGEGSTAGREVWPVVAELWSVPVEEEKKVPMKKGEVRTWVWTTGDIPADYDGPLHLRPVGVDYE